MTSYANTVEGGMCGSCTSDPELLPLPVVRFGPLLFRCLGELKDSFPAYFFPLQSKGEDYGSLGGIVLYSSS